MVRTERYKYAHYADGSAELYDLENDPDELVNRAGDAQLSHIEHDLKSRLLEHWIDNQKHQSNYVSAPQYWVREALEADYKKQQEEGGDLRYRPLY